jgi:NADH pyrophosphatase NudC (nudix superfamily)
MTRLIDADKIPWTDLSDGRGLCYVTFLEKVQRLPTVDAQPVRHARLVNASPYGECSYCGELIDSRDRFRYCPHCGAMLVVEGEKDDSD